MDIRLLHAAVAAACPIDGIAVGNTADRATWRIDFARGATQEQRAAARAIIEAFDPEAPAPDPSQRQIHPFDFRQRFTRDQRVAFDGSTDPDVVDLRGAFYACDAIGLDDAATIGGLGLLVSKGIIAAGDVAALRADRRAGERSGR